MISVADSEESVVKKDSSRWVPERPWTLGPAHEHGPFPRPVPMPRAADGFDATRVALKAADQGQVPTKSTRKPR